MAEWKKPELVELGIEKTEHNWVGIYSDGGYIGDGIVSGHASWTKPSNANNNDDAYNSDSVDALS